ncbi:MAG: hypothetical protein U0325_11240 [Polyangiales bacterium]
MAAPADAQRRSSRRSSRRAPTPAASRASGTGPGPFAGSWNVASNTEVSVTTPVVRTESRQTRESVVVGPAAGADMEIQVTNERGESCRLLANRRGAAITFPAEQQCYFTDPIQGIAFSFTLQRGSGAVRAGALSLDLAWSVFANIGMAINGTAVQRSQGSQGPAFAAPAAPGVAANPWAQPQPMRTW